MRTTSYFLYTMKEDSSQAESISHKLMLKSGMIRQISTGMYAWLPNGCRVLQKIQNIIREEMKKIGSIEISMSAIQPADLWEKSQRLEKYGGELFKIIDRNQRLLVLSPTYEEIITSLMSKENLSYKNLPVNIFQISNKFRDEIRPRSGVIRTREFLMKDGYSFHENNYSLIETYKKMYISYTNIFRRFNLIFKILQVDPGPMGGILSHEFRACLNYDLDKNDNLTQNYFFDKFKKSKNLSLMKVKNFKNTKFLSNLLNISIKKIVKTFLVKTNKNSLYKFAILLIRGDTKLNIEKIKKISIILKPFTLATKKEIYELLGIKNIKYLGPIGLNFPIISDCNVFKMKNFASGANIDGKYFLGINWIYDLPQPHYVHDICDVKINKNDIIDDNKVNSIIEIGHIFQLGTKYSSIINFNIKNSFGEKKHVNMGCYGIGISRIIPAIIEQNYDKKGIIWPTEIAPFTIAIVPINMHKISEVKYHAEFLYKKLIELNIDVILDDRKSSFGIMLSDIELIGIPHIIVISNKNIVNRNVEYINRKNTKSKIIKFNEIIDFIKIKINFQ